ncbi:MAG: hypothetical protein ABII02_03695 [Candidatus Magasanikbacteria bacterium]
MENQLFILFKISLTQILGIFGVFFVFGYVLSQLQRYIHKQYMQSVGWKGILWTGIIGTPIHEIGHYIFAKLFLHRIEKVSLFKPNKETGGLGHVNHSYHKKSIFQNIGNFFIGAAPLIFGSGVLYLLFRFFLSGSSAMFDLLRSTDLTSFNSIWISVRQVGSIFLSAFDASSWKWWLFLYLSFAVSSHLAPSKQDQKGMWSGFIWIVCIIIIINTIALFAQSNITSSVLGLSQYLRFLTAIFLYATFVSVLHFLIASIILFPFRKKK